MLLPGDAISSLEYDKVLELLAEKSMGDLGRTALRNLRPITDVNFLQERLDEVEEYRLGLLENDYFPIPVYEDLTEDLRMLEVEGYVLPVEGLQRIHRALTFIRRVFRFFRSATRQQTYPRLYGILSTLHFDQDLIKAIDKVVDEDGNIRADASGELLRIRKLIISKQKECDRKFRVLINQYKSKGYLTDNLESIRNGRRVLSVPSEHKRKIRGIIHDESTTGKTAFIEPEAVIHINNDLFDLEVEEKREIYRILKELSTTLRPYVVFMRGYQRALVRYDVIQAKAHLAVQMEAIKPILKPKPHLKWKEARHPLLLLKNKVANRKTVPFDLHFKGDNRLLILSGPNAGGKSITMKSVGLIQMMVQSGCLVPMEENSEVGVFERIFTDIGDQQSIEDDLSTYSSRLANAKSFLEHANGKTLILIDEFGSGTDPKIGGAIAEAILRALNFKKVYGVVTTHYSNLKIFAFKTRGLLNAAMVFNKDNLTPTYELKVGRPGSSYGFEIAQKIGLDKKVLNYARHRTGKNEKAVDQLLVELQQDKKQAEEQVAELLEKQKNLEKLIATYDSLEKEVESRRQMLRLDRKEQELQSAAEENKEIQRVIHEIRKEQNIQKAKELAKKAQEKKKVLEHHITKIKQDIYTQKAKKAGKLKPIEVGDHVRIVVSGSIGEVERIKKNKAIVMVGGLTMETELLDLEPVSKREDKRPKQPVKIHASSKPANADQKLDIRGMRAEEAMRMVEAFVDQSLMADDAVIEILHGKGTGALRQIVRNKLKEYNVKMKVYHPNREDGGDGITIVEFL